jgi:iron complex transport system ATP-binding protein
MTPSFYTQNLFIDYPNKEKKSPNNLIEDANISLQPHKLTVILGLNGVGKSTLLRTLAGLQNNYIGTIYLNDNNLKDYSLVEKAKEISVVLTEKITSNYLTVSELVSLGRMPYTNWTGVLSDTDQEKIVESLQQTQISPLAHRYLHTLSDGQLQKTFIARALTQASNFMFLDEPTTHLDLCNKAEIWHLLKKITKEQQKTVLVTSHDLDFALQIADSIWLIYQKKVHCFSPAELRENKMLENVFYSNYFEFREGLLQIK